jgi:hypothetical protein
MKSSSDRILTTHTGSLPRSKALSALLVKREQHKTYDAGALQAEIECNLDLVVKRSKSVAATSATTEKRRESDFQRTRPNA